MANWWQTPLGEAKLKELRETAAVRTSKRVPARMSQRMYQNARGSRLASDWNPGISSADTELITSLQVLRSRSRALVRDASYAKRARTVIVNNVIGTGIGMQAQVRNLRDDTLIERINDDIEAAFDKWSYADSCHTGGALSFQHFERALMGQVFEAGEVFIRRHSRKFGNSEVNYALELVEAERIADDIGAAPYRILPGNQVRLGIEVDPYMRPAAYYLRHYHPAEIRFNTQTDFVERVPAGEIIHLRLVDRWPQTRGEPWMHSILRRLNDMDGYSEAEIDRARTQACIVGAIQTDQEPANLADKQEDGSLEFQLAPGSIPRLAPGETLNAQTPSAPNPQMDPFMRYMLREVAAGCGVSYESLSRDYSQSNYSSSRLAILDDRDLWRFFQSWFICDFRRHVHEDFVRQAVLSGALSSVSVEQYASDPSRFEAAKFRPRGWAWIDPVSEVQAYKEAVRCGFASLQDVLTQTGDSDVEEVFEERAKEIKLAAENNLVFDSNPEQTALKGQVQPETPQNPATPAPKPAATTTTQQPAPKRVVSFRNHET